MALGRTNFPAVKQDGSDTDQQKANVVNQCVLGKLNCTLDVTLTAGATSTTIEDPRVYETSVFLLDPRTASARLALYSAYVSAVSKGEFTITHANVAAVDQRLVVGIFA